MPASASEQFDLLVSLIKEVKPGLGDEPVKMEHSVVEDLGLDSLDILQLSRKIHRDMGTDFDLDTWNEGADTHNRSVESILDNIGATADV
jgi:acyl carrier protein